MVGLNHGLWLLPTEACTAPACGAPSFHAGMTLPPLPADREADLVLCAVFCVRAMKGMTLFCPPFQCV